VPKLLLHGKQIETVFDLLGKKENDLTYALGWALANSRRLTDGLLADVASELGLPATDGEADVRLQEYVPRSGYTDVEIRTSTMHVILEAKRGWVLPGEPQLAKYALSLTPGLPGALLIAAEGSPAFATGKYPAFVPGPDGSAIAVLYRSWKQLTQLSERLASGAGAESRLLREVSRYLRGLMNLQDQRDNMAYVVSLGAHPTDWTPISPRDIVLNHRTYFHPVGGQGKGGWPKEPPNYLAFRFDGRLQQIHHVDSVEVTQRPRDHIPGFTIEHDFEDPHYLYTLGAPIKPDHEVKNGRVVMSARVWAALDLLLVSETISDARDRTNERLAEAGE
jgi:hypothetical protein